MFSDSISQTISVIEDLEPSSSYRFRVSATNELGTSDMGEQTDLVKTPDQGSFLFLLLYLKSTADSRYKEPRTEMKKGLEIENFIRLYYEGKSLAISRVRFTDSLLYLFLVQPFVISRN